MTARIDRAPGRILMGGFRRIGRSEAMIGFESWSFIFHSEANDSCYSENYPAIDSSFIEAVFRRGRRRPGRFANTRPHYGSSDPNATSDRFSAHGSRGDGHVVLSLVHDVCRKGCGDRSPDESSPRRSKETWHDRCLHTDQRHCGLREFPSTEGGSIGARRTLADTSSRRLSPVRP